MSKAFTRESDSDSEEDEDEEAGDGLNERTGLIRK